MVVGIAGHGSIAWSRGWLAGFQLKPLDFKSLAPNLHLAMQFIIIVINPILIQVYPHKRG